MKAVALALALGWAAVGCGADDDGPSCESVGARVCDLACACTDGDECAIVLGAVTLTHDNPGDCSGFWVTLACMDEEADEVDWAACGAAVESAECVDSGDGMALAYPSADCGDAQQ